MYMREMLQFEITTTPGSNILTPGQPVLAMTLKRLASGRASARAMILEHQASGGLAASVPIYKTFLIPSTYQVVWSAAFCQLLGQHKRQRRRVSSFGISFKGTYISFLKFRITFTLDKIY